MINVFNKTSYKVISLFIKTGIFILSIWYILLKLMNADLQLNFANLLPKLNSGYFICAFLLVIINWGVEAIKWKYLIRKLEKISFALAFKSILAGVAISIFTPNRIGEFAGRIFYLQSTEKTKATMISLFGSLLQLSVTVLFGGIACVIYFNHYQVSILYLLSSSGLLLISGLLILVVIGLLALSIKQNSIKNKLSEMVCLFNLKELATIFFLSATRYLVFSFQYYLIILLFGVDVSFINSLVITSTIFFVGAAIPSFAISEISVRGATSIYFFNAISNDHPSILAASLLLWIINLAIPAIVGSAYIWNLNFFEDK